MDRRKKVRLIFCFIILGVTAVLLAGGCATTKKGVSVSGPEWAKRGMGAFLDREEKVFYGVGAVTGIKNKPLAITSADNRARAEISKLFETYSASLMKDYTASTIAGDGSGSSEEQHIEQAIKTFSATTISGIMIVDHWTDSDGTLYSLARLNLDSFKDNLKRMKDLNEGIRDFVRKNAEKSFEELAAEEEKRIK
ncbi:MAG: LPP20 family lipoprotein [Nitrospirota bacterium]